VRSRGALEPDGTEKEARNLHTVFLLLHDNVVTGKASRLCRELGGGHSAQACFVSTCLRRKHSSLLRTHPGLGLPLRVGSFCDGPSLLMLVTPGLGTVLVHSRHSINASCMEECLNGVMQS
jgi:hypothetical protein